MVSIVDGGSYGNGPAYDNRGITLTACDWSMTVLRALSLSPLDKPLDYSTANQMVEGNRSCAVDIVIYVSQADRGDKDLSGSGL